MEAPAMEMPRYKSHKTVWALKIAKVDHNSETSYGAMLTPAEAGFAPFEVSAEYIAKHNPQEGGYYVVYADGYKSFSPAKAFEEGNTLEGASAPNHAEGVLYPAIKAAMLDLETLKPGVEYSVDRAYNHLHRAFWSECPRPACEPDLRPTEPAADAPNPS